VGTYWGEEEEMKHESCLKNKNKKAKSARSDTINI
jgi:hypothetical protein